MNQLKNLWALRGPKACGGFRPGSTSAMAVRRRSLRAVVLGHHGRSLRCSLVAERISTIYPQDSCCLAFRAVGLHTSDPFGRPAQRRNLGKNRSVFDVDSGIGKTIWKELIIWVFYSSRVYIHWTMWMGSLRCGLAQWMRFRPSE